MVPGLFLGYHLSAGGKWRGDYLAVPLSALRGVPLEETAARVSVHRVREVYHNSEAGFDFPLKPLYDRSRRSLEECPAALDGLDTGRRHFWVTLLGVIPQSRPWSPVSLLSHLRSHLLLLTPTFPRLR